MVPKGTTWALLATVKVSRVSDNCLCPSGMHLFNSDKENTLHAAPLSTRQLTGVELIDTLTTKSL